MSHDLNIKNKNTSSFGCLAFLSFVYWYIIVREKKIGETVLIAINICLIWFFSLCEICLITRMSLVRIHSWQDERKRENIAI